jgi:hypothetical protein
MNVLLLTQYDFPGASSGLRTYQYVPRLRFQGTEIRAAPFLGNDYLQSLLDVNTQLVEPEVNGLLATAPDEWKRALARLAADPELRVRLGRAGRRRVEERYSLQVMAPRVESLLRVAAGGV